MIIFDKKGLLDLLDDYGIKQSTTDMIDSAVQKYKDVYGEDDKYGIFSDFFLRRIGTYIKVAEKWHISKTAFYKKLDYICDKLITIINDTEGEKTISELERLLNIPDSVQREIERRDLCDSDSD